MDRAIPITIFVVSTFSVAQAAISIQQFRKAGQTPKSNPSYGFSIFMIILSFLMMVGSLWFTIHPKNPIQQKEDKILEGIEKIIGMLAVK